MENNENVKPSQAINIAGFILSFFFPVIGLILSIIGLSRSKETGVGKGFSIAGIVISGIKIILGILLAVLVWMFLSNNLPGVINSVTKSLECSEAYDCVLNNDGTYNCKYDSLLHGDTEEITCTKKQVSDYNLTDYDPYFGDYNLDFNPEEFDSKDINLEDN